MQQEEEESKSYETAIAEFESGLAQKTSEKGDDGGLTEKLKAALAAATAAKAAQDKAREEALVHCNAGEVLLAGDIGSDTIERAIASYEAGLALQEQTNGDVGWESCMERLSTNIASATGLKRLQVSDEKEEQREREREREAPSDKTIN